MTSSKKLIRHKSLKNLLRENPFSTDEQLAQMLGVSVQTIRLDRVTLGIPELRARTRTMAEDAQTKVRAIDKKDIVGELIDMELNNRKTSSVVDAEYALTAVGNVKYKMPVNAGATLVARAVVTHRRMDRFYIFVSVKNNNEEVFRAKYIIVSLDERTKHEREQEA